MRVTTHNGRFNADGAFSARHNDRNFEISKSDHIDASKSAGNRYLHRYSQTNPEWTFDQAEQAFYLEFCQKSLNAQNDRYIANRKPEHVRTIDEYRKSKQSCPEETIFQIGRSDETVDPDILIEIVKKQMMWEQKTFPQCKILNMAIHMDETTPHVHVRRAWIGHNKHGETIISQSKSLSEMGVDRPDPSRPKNRWNNPKMTYTRACRDHFIGLCREYGLEIETRPREQSKSGQSLLSYQRNQDERKLAEIAQKMDKIKQMDGIDQALEIADQASEIARLHDLCRSYGINPYERPKSPEMPQIDDFSHGDR